MSVKSNLLEYIRFKGIKKTEFYRVTGLSNGFLDKNQNISSNNLEIIISNYKDINLHWLLTGEPPMLKSDIKIVDQNADMAQTQPAIFNTAKMQEPTLTQKSVALYEELIAQLKERIADQKRTITLLEKLLMRVIWEKTENGIPPAEKESPNTASLPQS